MVQRVLRDIESINDTGPAKKNEGLLCLKQCFEHEDGTEAGGEDVGQAQAGAQEQDAQRQEPGLGRLGAELGDRQWPHVGHDDAQEEPDGDRAEDVGQDQRGGVGDRRESGDEGEAGSGGDQRRPTDQAVGSA